MDWHHGNDVQWRLSSVRRTLEKLPMYAAAWQSLDRSMRTDIRLEWSGVLRDWEFLEDTAERMARTADIPEWYMMIALEIEEHERLIEHMNLNNPLTNVILECIIRTDKERRNATRKGETK